MPTSHEVSIEEIKKKKETEVILPVVKESYMLTKSHYQ